MRISTSYLILMHHSISDSDLRSAACYHLVSKRLALKPKGSCVRRSPENVVLLEKGACRLRAPLVCLHERLKPSTCATLNGVALHEEKRALNLKSCNCIYAALRPGIGRERTRSKIASILPRYSAPFSLQQATRGIITSIGAPIC